MSELRNPALILWNITQSSQPQESYEFQRTFPDGIDVIITVSPLGKLYEVRTSVESRTSGPNNTIVGSNLSLNEALALVAQECEEWNKYLV